jgi:uncharacterized protein
MQLSLTVNNTAHTLNVPPQTLLVELDENNTQLSYQAKVQVGGKLAQIGSRIVDAASEKIIGDFFTKLEAMLCPKPTETAEQAVQAFAGYLGW